MARSSSLPAHLGFIIDGNRRWAKAHALPAKEGHTEGYRALKTVLLDVLSRGVEYASVYIFSTENWSRSSDEVEHLMRLFVRVLHDDAQLFIDNNIRVRILGSRKRLSKKLISSIERVEALTEHLEGGQLLLCLNYGGQQEIADAVTSLLREGHTAADITPALIEQFLYTPDVPPCDMIIRTGGEQRLSNFMLWRSAYSELMFIEKYWPEMTKRDVTRILKEYTNRARRFGG